MTLSVGLDMSLEKTAICVISAHGKMVKEVPGGQRARNAVVPDLQPERRNCHRRT